MFCGAKPRTFARGKAEPRGLVMRNTLSVILGFGRSKKGLKLKSLILAQIERWRHALHMQVERQHGELAFWWRVANG